MPKEPNSLQLAIGKFAQWLLPTKPLKNWYNWRGSEPNFFANTLDVDRLRQVLGDAETGNVRNLFALYRDVIISDSHIQGEIAKRKLAVLGDTLSIQPFEKKNTADVAAAAFIKARIEDFPGFTEVCGHMLDGFIYPLSITEKTFNPSTVPGVRYEIGTLTAVQPNIIDYALNGRLMLRKLDPHTGWITGEYEEPDPNRYIIHRGHLLNQVDFWGGPMRSIMFWWLMRSMARDWWARFLERYGSPFLVGKYDQSDDASRSVLTAAFSSATKIFGLVISNETQVELIEAASGQTGEAFEKFHDRCNDEISKLIVGQTASSNMKSTGMGSGVSKQHENVRQDIRQFDSRRLGETLRDQLFKPLLEYNGIGGRAPRAVWGGGLTPVEQESLANSIQYLSQAGIEPTDEAVENIGEQFGFPLQRKAPPPVPPPPGDQPPGFSRPGLHPLAARDPLVHAAQSSVDRIAAAGAPDLARAFRGSLAPVRRIILESSSAAECEHHLRAFYADWSPDKVAPVIERALAAFAANGTAVQAR